MGRGAARRSLRSFIHSCFVYKDDNLRIKVFCKLAGLTSEKFDGSMVSQYLVPVLKNIFESPYSVAATWLLDDDCMVEWKKFKTFALTEPCFFFVKLLPFASPLLESVQSAMVAETIKIRNEKMINLDIGLSYALRVWQFLQKFDIIRRQWAARAFQAAFRRSQATRLEHHATMISSRHKKLHQAQELDRQLSQGENGEAVG